MLQMNFILGLLIGVTLSASNLIWWKNVVKLWRQTKPSQGRILFRICFKMVVIALSLYLVIIYGISLFSFCLGIALPLVAYTATITLRQRLRPHFGSITFLT